MERKITSLCCILMIVITVVWLKYTVHPSVQTIFFPLKPSNQSQVHGQVSYSAIPLASIRKDCSELCDTTRKGTRGLYFDHITAAVNCEAIFKNQYVDLGHNLPHAPKEIPKDLRKEFTMNNRLHVKPYYFDQKYLGGDAHLPLWTKEQIDEWVALSRQGKLPGNYKIPETNFLRDGLNHAPEIKNGRVLVIGSQTPWVEACVLEAGAREVVTLEYGHIVSKHPKVKTMVPHDFRMSFLNKTLGAFDAIVSFSSIEHSGLGRYGDALNPWGDIIAIARSWCVTKPGGSLTLGVPYVNSGVDYIAFNAGRFYGKIRYPYLTTNWKQLYRGQGGIHRVHVFIKPNKE